MYKNNENLTQLQIDQMEHYRRKKEYERINRWRHEHPDKAAACRIRSACRMCNKYPELGYLFIAPLADDNEQTIEAVLSDIEHRIRSNAANGYYKGGASK